MAEKKERKINLEKVIYGLPKKCPFRLHAQKWLWAGVKLDFAVFRHIEPFWPITVKCKSVEC